MKEHLLKQLATGVRYDGRKFDELRPVSITYDVSASAEGSAQIKIGDTEIIAGVKMEVSTPYPDSPDTGNLMVSAELSPMASPRFEQGPPGIEAIELARVVDRGIRESHTVDTKSLCIEPGKAVWTVIVDVVMINADGNLITSSGLAALAALKNAKFPAWSAEDGIDYSTKTDKAVPVSRTPIAVTIFKIGEHLLVDPTREEEQFCEGRLTITVSEKDTICAMQKGGSSPFTIEQVDKMASMAIKCAKQLRKAL
jgi:exosome complex component RRP42